MDERTSHTDDIRLGDYLGPILSRKWLILAVVVLATAGTYAYYERQPARYEASTKVFLGQASSDPLAAVGGSFGSDREIQNQATLLTSREIVARVAKRIGYRGSLDALAGRVVAAPSEGSDFVTVTASSADPREAARVANGFADAFVSGTTARQRSRLRSTISQIQTQLNNFPANARNAGERSELASSIRRYQLQLRLATGSAVQVDPAGVPASAVAPRPVRSAIFAFALALAAGLGLAFGMERFDRRLKRVEDASSFYDLPVLTTLPHDDANDYVAHGLSAVSPHFKEAFRQLRSNLQLATLDNPPRRILVTSALPGEGKSTVVRNLAIVFREWGHRVAVVDCDLRSPSMAALFHADLDSGLTDVLIGERTLANVMMPVGVEAVGLATLDRIHSKASADGPTDRANGHHAGEDPFEGITLIGPGPRPSNPSAVLAAERTREVLDEISATHDIVLIDTPPVLAVTDAVPLLSEVDGVLLVARLGHTTKDSARRVNGADDPHPGRDRAGHRGQRPRRDRGHELRAGLRVRVR